MWCCKPCYEVVPVRSGSPSSARPFPPRCAAPQTQTLQRDRPTAPAARSDHPDPNRPVGNTTNPESLFFCCFFKILFIWVHLIQVSVWTSRHSGFYASFLGTWTQMNFIGHADALSAVSVIHSGTFWSRNGILFICFIILRRFFSTLNPMGCRL